MMKNGKGQRKESDGQLGKSKCRDEMSDLRVLCSKERAESGAGGKSLQGDREMPQTLSDFKRVARYLSKRLVRGPQA